MIYIRALVNISCWIQRCVCESYRREWVHNKSKSTECCRTQNTSTSPSIGFRTDAPGWLSFMKRATQNSVFVILWWLKSNSSVTNSLLQNAPFVTSNPWLWRKLETRSEVDNSKSDSQLRRFVLCWYRYTTACFLGYMCEQLQRCNDPVCIWWCQFNEIVRQSSVRMTEIQTVWVWIPD